ncbi:sensor histidine kinase [sulfur-oxidizing endosymbiont of Gigantopelta aegis]|uniref:sensor histidine kinase n=1 Tax=sulfur-oxidizing endosymbiont of Gigantopelta aegis TaxID=2794934 RepID=UPI0018DC6A2D|nr:ATP-binding protein [sulfur-oxidizing endosymbiont of Gigantopelta aegis]
MRHSYPILILCFAIIIALLLYTLSENRTNAITSHEAWQQYDEDVSKLVHISAMLNEMQHLTRLYLATTTTEDPFELDTLIITASLKRSLYILHSIDLRRLNLDTNEQEFLSQLDTTAGKIRLAQIAYDEMLRKNVPLKERLDLAIQTIISPQNKNQVLMQGLLHYIRTHTITVSSNYHTQEEQGHARIKKLQLITIYLTFFFAFLSTYLIAKGQKTIQDKNKDLMKAKSFLKSAINSTPIALLIINKDGLIVMANNNAAQVFQYSQDELINMNVSELIPENIRPKHQQYLDSYCNAPVNREMNNGLTITARRQSGEIFPAEVGLNPVDDQDEMFIACSVKDITDQKNMENEIIASKNKAEQANQAKSDFLANVSHELRTPLHAILSFSRLGLKNLKKEPKLSSAIPKFENYLDKIFTSGDKLLGFITDLLDSAKFESGKMELEYVQADILQLINVIINEQEARIHELELEVKISAKYYNQHACFDKHYIGQTISNLISNAIKYSPQGGTITILITTCQYHNMEALQVSVQDEGLGIPNEQLSLIFDKFVQSTNKIAGGTGLGLSLCKNIIEAHGGTIWAENADKTLLKNAHFSFIIPTIQSPRLMTSDNN